MKLAFTNFGERNPDINFFGDITKSSFETCFQYKMCLRNSVQTPNYKIIRIFLSRDSILFLTKGVKRVREAEFSYLLKRIFLAKFEKPFLNLIKKYFL